MDEIKGGKTMKRTKWIVGLSIVGIMALSGTAFAFTTGTPTVKTTQNQETSKTLVDTAEKGMINSGSLATSQPTAPSNPLGSPQLGTLTPSSQNTDSNALILLWVPTDTVAATE